MEPAYGRKWHKKKTLLYLFTTHAAKNKQDVKMYLLLCRAPTSLRRTQRKAAREAIAAMAQQQRRRHQFKHTSSDVARRNNKAFQKMPQMVYQPRKCC